MRKSNQNALKDGFARAIRLAIGQETSSIERQGVVGPVFNSVAEHIWTKAIEYFNEEESNLTGNTLSGIACGVYAYGTLKKTYVSTISPTSGMVEAGPCKEFIDYDSGEVVNYVENYSTPSLDWQETDEGKFAKDLAKEFIREYRTRFKKGFGFVVVSGSPYSTWLNKVRKLDLLQSAFADSKPELLQQLKAKGIFAR